MDPSGSVIRKTKRHSKYTKVVNGVGSGASFPSTGTSFALDGGHRSVVATLQTRSGSATYAVKFYGNPDATALRSADTTKELFARRKDAAGASATGLLSTVTANGHNEVDVDGIGVLWAEVTSLTGGGLLDVWVRESDNGSPIRNQAAWIQAKAGAADGGTDGGHHLRVGGTVEAEIPSAANNGTPYGLSLNSYRFLRTSAHAAARSVTIGKADITADEQYFDPATNGLSKGGILTQHLIGGKIGSEDAAPITVTADAATDAFTATAHGLANGDTVQVASTGTLPGGFTALTIYYVVGATANTFQLAATAGGSAIDVTSAGTGTVTVVEILFFTSSNSRLWIPMLVAPQRYNALTVGLYIDYDDRYRGATSGGDPTITDRSFNVQIWAAYDETDPGAYFKLLPDVVVPAMTVADEDMRLLFTGAPLQEYATAGDPTGVVTGAQFYIPAFRGGTIPGVQFKITRIGPAYSSGAITSLIVSRSQ
jgi:hypothetical protein